MADVGRFPGRTPTGRWPAAVALVAAILGLAFAGSSTLDYAQHLDRQVHDIHCSYVPGAGAEPGADNACRVAMYSPYAALFRDRYWGGVPISLFAVGAFAFFIAFATYALLAGRHAPRRAAQFLGLAGVTPLLVSLAMLAISALRLGQFCKTCVGIYVASGLLAFAGIAALVVDARAAKRAASASPTLPAGSPGGVAPTIVDDVLAGEPPRPAGSLALIPAWLLALGIFAVTPALLYVSALPSYATYIASCGKLEKPADETTGALRVTPAGAIQPATLFVDPLCPTCKAFHKRLVAEGLFDQLDTTLVLFPLDSECNWMLDRPLHPGACVVSKAVLCADRRALAVLEWSYEHQDEILEKAKGSGGAADVRAMLKVAHPDLDACIDAKDTARKLDKMLRYIVANRLPVSTPQLFVGDTRLCDEDSDMGLPYAIRKLAPGLARP